MRPTGSDFRDPAEIEVLRRLRDGDVTQPPALSRTERLWAEWAARQDDETVARVATVCEPVGADDYYATVRAVNARAADVAERLVAEEQEWRERQLWNGSWVTFHGEYEPWECVRDAQNAAWNALAEERGPARSRSVYDYDVAYDTAHEFEDWIDAIESLDHGGTREQIEDLVPA